MIKAICFDLDGVYFDANGFASFKQKLVELGARTGDVDEQLHGQMMQQFKKGLTAEDDFWSETIKKLGLSLTVDETKDLLVSDYTVNPVIKRAVENARQQGYKTCVCSNNFRTRIDKLQQKFGFLDDFDEAVFSCDVGELKPSKKIYETLLGKLGIEPHELVYADDNESKLFGANELGIRTFVYQSDEQFISELAKIGVDIQVVGSGD